VIKISPSLLATDFSNLTIPLNQCELGGASMIHIDVMDGNFVPNITMGPVIINGIRKATNLLLDVHLMINKPENFISEFINVGSDLITFHVEATKNPLNLIKQIKDEGLKCGITLKPSSDISLIENYIENVDLILIMSVEPGFGGQKFIPDMLDRIYHVKDMTNKLISKPNISVDGDVKLSNAKKIIDAGADILVAGTGIFGTPDPILTMKKFNNLGEV
tara:strand:+ start:9422 stop:10078 length:657 start_codon:yes stop_codon:yes gene_type:complete